MERLNDELERIMFDGVRFDDELERASNAVERVDVN